MIKATKFKLIRAEGPTYLCGIVERAYTWDQANYLLRAMAHTAPKKMGYDKVDFWITFEDGYVYQGRYDLKHYLTEFPNLRKHVYDHVSFHAGIRKPHWQTDEQYAQCMELYREHIPDYLDFYNNYDLGGLND